jgi:hypothetical protein
MSGELYEVGGKTIFPIMELKEGRDPNVFTNYYPEACDVTGYCSFAVPEDEQAWARLLGKGDARGLPQIHRTKEEYEAQR